MTPAQLTAMERIAEEVHAAGRTVRDFDQSSFPVAAALRCLMDKVREVCAAPCGSDEQEALVQELEVEAFDNAFLVLDEAITGNMHLPEWQARNRIKARMMQRAAE